MKSIKTMNYEPIQSPTITIHSPNSSLYRSIHHYSSIYQSIENHHFPMVFPWNRRWFPIFFAKNRIAMATRCTSATCLTSPPYCTSTCTWTARADCRWTWRPEAWNHGKTRGKPWENGGFMGFQWDFMGIKYGVLENTLVLEVILRLKPPVIRDFPLPFLMGFTLW